jgi:major membrane immunogen (membrane-anchored lipoprotein)
MTQRATRWTNRRGDGVKNVTRIIAAVAMLLALGACKQDVNANQPQTGRSCDETCTNEADTITVSAVWLTPTGVPDGAIPNAEVSWTVGGVVQYDGERPLSKTGAVYRAWYHSWKKNNYPRISITADEKVHGGVYCQIKYAFVDKDGKVKVDVVDYAALGPKAPPGSVTCTSDAWLNTHLNHDQ